MTLTDKTFCRDSLAVRALLYQEVTGSIQPLSVLLSLMMLSTTHRNRQLALKAATAFLRSTLASLVLTSWVHLCPTSLMFSLQLSLMITYQASLPDQPIPPPCNLL